jgi:hypothetical protein
MTFEQAASVISLKENDTFTEIYYLSNGDRNWIKKTVNQRLSNKLGKPTAYAMSSLVLNKFFNTDNIYVDGLDLVWSDKTVVSNCTNYNWKEIITFIENFKK